MRRTQLQKKLPRTFTGLSKLRPLYVIQDEADYERARSIADALMMLTEPTDGQERYSETLLLIMEAYETQHYPLKRAMDPLEALKYLLERNAMNASDLGRLLGNRPLGAAILRGERGLSKTHIRVLAERFKVNPGLFLEKSPASRRRHSA